MLCLHAILVNGQQDFYLTDCNYRYFVVYIFSQILVTAYSHCCIKSCRHLCFIPRFQMQSCLDSEQQVEFRLKLNEYGFLTLPCQLHVLYIVRAKL